MVWISDMHTAPRFDDVTVARIAAETDTDPRTVIRRIAGLPVVGRPGARIDRVLARVMGTRPPPAKPPATGERARR